MCRHGDIKKNSRYVWKITVANIFNLEKPIGFNFLQSFSIKNMIFISFLYLANPKIIMKSLL